MTFRIDAELAKRLKESVAKSGGKLTQAEVIESALADRFAVKDGTKLLAKVNQDQATAVTLVKEQSQQLAEFQTKVRDGINGFAKRMHDDVARLEQTTMQEMRGTAANVSTLQSQMAGMVGTLRQVEYHVQQTTEARLSMLHWLGLVGLIALAIVGVVAIGAGIWWRFLA